MRGCLTQANVTLNDGVVGERSEVLAYLADDLIVEPITHIHREHKALDVERWVKAALNHLDGIEQLAKTLQSQILALHRHKHRVGSRENIDRSEA